jgi:hypothetical protein
MDIQFHRYLEAGEFARDLNSLQAYRNEYVAKGLLESLEAAGLLLPRIRIRYPDPVARRFWLITHGDRSHKLIHATEPDGPRWDAAVELSDALHKWRNHIFHRLGPNPLDDPEQRFVEFLQRPAEVPFEPQQHMRVDVSSKETRLFDDHNCERYYSTWQLLLAAEVADAGVHMRINLADPDTAQSMHEELKAGRLPEGAPYSFNLVPVRTARDFVKYEKALDAVVWFMEERSRALNYVIKGQGGRFLLNEEQRARMEQATADATAAATERFHVGVDDLIALIRFLSERWTEWNRQGRPLVADAYKEFLGGSVFLTRHLGKLSFAVLRDRVGRVGGWFMPILDIIWPNWAEEEKERASRTLKSAMRGKCDAVPEADIDAFVEFLASEGLEAFFWRLKSFEDHAFRGNEFALEGMKSDLQGMALAVEHVAAALGGTATQLYEKFKQLWCEPDVLGILKRGSVTPLARQARLAQDWPALKMKINTLRDEKGGNIAADLILTHRIRGGVHTISPEDDQFEMESLFMALMRAAVFTFVEVRRKPSKNSTAVGGDLKAQPV